MAKLPLNGVRVIDMGTMLFAGPSACMFLGDLGAEVIRVESLQRIDARGRGDVWVPPGANRAGYPNGDPGARPWERAANFSRLGRQKLSMTVNFYTDEGREIVYRLVQVSDAFVENSAPGSMDKLGFSWPVLQKLSPKLVMASLSGFGNTGRYRPFRGGGSTFEAASGFYSLLHYPDIGLSSIPSSLHSDAAAGASGALAVLMALYHANRTGTGQYIDLSQAENVAHHLGDMYMDYSMNRRVNGAPGNRHPFMAPHGCYPCLGEDNWCVIAVSSDDEWQALCQVMGQAELLSDPRFADPLSRHRHQDELDQIISAWTRTKDKYELMDLLQPRVPAGPVISHLEAFENPHLRAREFFQEVTSKATGTHLYPRPYYKFSKTPLNIRRPAPLLGEHNEYVYKHVLGYSDAEYERFVKEEHIGDTYVELLQESGVGGA